MTTFAYEAWLFIILGKIQNFCYAIFITICSYFNPERLQFNILSSFKYKYQITTEVGDKEKKSPAALSVTIEQLLIIFDLKYQFCEIVMYLGSYWVESPYQNWFHLLSLLYKHKMDESLPH